MSLMLFFLLQLQFHDATIACNGKMYPVHRFVLSTCSEYFETIFLSLSDNTSDHSKHPVLVINDVPCDILEALLRYMYAGDVNVQQEKLFKFISAAEYLMIKGLAVPDEDQKLQEQQPNSNVIGEGKTPVIYPHSATAVVQEKRKYRSNDVHIASTKSDTGVISDNSLLNPCKQLKKSHSQVNSTNNNLSTSSIKYYSTSSTSDLQIKTNLTTSQRKGINCVNSSTKATTTNAFNNLSYETEVTKARIVGTKNTVCNSSTGLTKIRSVVFYIFKGRQRYTCLTYNVTTVVILLLLCIQYRDIYSIANSIIYICDVC